MPKEIQGRLAGIRTDLDTFSDAEAYALMLSGYRMTGFEFGRCIPGLPVSMSACGLEVPVGLSGSGPQTRLRERQSPPPEDLEDRFTPAV